MNAFLFVVLWLGLAGASVKLFGIGWGSIYLLLGLMCDKLCENQAKKKGERYSGAVQLCAFIFGPVFIPAAMLLAFGKAFLSMFKSPPK